MGVLPTTIGSYPKPPWLPLPDWFRAESANRNNPTDFFETYLRRAPAAEAELVRTTHWAVAAQVDAGIDVPTDG